MIKLLRSGLLRLIKCKPFYIALAIQAGLMLLMTLNYYLTGLNPNIDVHADMAFPFTVCSPVSPILIAVVCSLFTGADYHNGTIRNKLIIGYPRYKIYLAGLIISLLVALCLNIASMAIFFPVTLPLLGGFAGDAKTLITLFLLGNLAMLVYASLYNTVAMTSKSIVASLIITIGALLFMMALSRILLAEINEPLTITELIKNEAGEWISEQIPNPSRKSEEVLTSFNVLLHIFPSGQTALLSEDKFTPWLMAVSSVCILCISTGAGIAVFNKENLK